MWLKTYFRHGFQNLTTNKDTWQISNKNSNNARYKKKENENGLDISCQRHLPNPSSKTVKVAHWLKKDILIFDIEIGN